MKLSNYDTIDDSVWDEKGYNLPEYNREQIIANTNDNPTWLHLGAGNIFRAFPATLSHKLLNQEKIDTGIIVAEGFDYEIIEKAYRPYNNLSLLTTLKADGEIDKNIIGSVTESLMMDSDNSKDYNRLKEVLKKDSLQLVSFTITEKGYKLTDSSGHYMGAVQKDFDNGPTSPISYMGKVTGLLYERYNDSASPIALVSMDNVSRNGTLLKTAIMEFANNWQENDLVDKGFIEYLSDENKVSFPWSMIDKITPRPDETVQNILNEDGFEDTEIIITDKNTYTAPFVNAEEAEYLVVEDNFPNGRPSLEEVGVMFTDRETVEKSETMKVSTCLNPLHTTLAIYGCLLGHTSIHEEMKDTELVELIKKVGYTEGLPVVVDPEIINPKEFIDEVINVRFPNPFMPDTPQRIATDTSQKISIRYGNTLQAYVDTEDKDVESLEFIPLVLAGWLRYLLQVDDNGNKMELSSDPELERILPDMQKITLGDTQDIEEKLKPILDRNDIFGVDLYEIGIARKVIGYFKELIQGPGAVRETLKKHLETN